MRDVGSAYEGTQEEIAQVLKLEIAARRAHMHKCLDAAMESFELMYTTPFEDRGGLQGVDMAPIFEFLEQRFGVEIDQADRMMCVQVLQEQMLRFQGISMCVLWQWAHAIEHATMREETRQ